jgi:Inorganic Pyrophosphatase
MQKAAKHPVVRRERFQDLDLAIEFPKGSKRPYRDDAGVEHFKTMFADYGEVRGTKGLDGDPVDVYVGPDRASSKVFVVTQMKKGDWDKVDEEKCILGVGSKSQARALYLRHYNDSRFCGAIRELDMAKFQEKLETNGAVGKKIAANAERIAELNYLRLQAGMSLLKTSGIKLGSVALPSQLGDGMRKAPVLGDRPDVDAVPGVTDFGKAQPGGKVAARDYTARAVALKRPTKDPVHEADKRRSEIKETELTRLEQVGLGIAPSKVVGDPTSTPARAKQAAINDFLKRAAADRFGRIADRVDDVGIGMLAAPYAAKAVGGAMSHAPGRWGAAGSALKAWGKNEEGHGKLPLELAGLALVAPGITHGVARRIDRHVPAKTAAATTVGYSQAPLAQRSGRTVGYSARPAAGPSAIDASGVFSIPPSTYPAGPPSHMTPASMVAPTVHGDLSAAAIPRAPRVPAEFAAQAQPGALAPTVAASTPSVLSQTAPTVAPGGASPTVAPPRRAGRPTVIPQGSIPPSRAALPAASGLADAASHTVVPAAATRAVADAAAVTRAPGSLLARGAAKLRGAAPLAKGLGRGVAGLGLAGLGVAGLGLGAGTMAASRALGHHGEHDLAPAGYTPPRLY